MKRTLDLAVLACLFTPLALAGSENPPAEVAAPAQPEMNLRVSAYHGMSPLELKLTGSVTLPESAAMKKCWIQAEWKNTTGIGLPFQTRSDIPCAGEKAVIKVPESFEKSLLLEKAGSYSYRIILEDFEGKRHASAAREVKVMEGALQLEVGASGDGL